MHYSINLKKLYIFLNTPYSGKTSSFNDLGNWNRILPIDKILKKLMLIEFYWNFSIDPSFKKWCFKIELYYFFHLFIFSHFIVLNFLFQLRAYYIELLLSMTLDNNIISPPSKIVSGFANFFKNGFVNN